MNFLSFKSKDIGIDLGTANILVTVKGKGIILREPSVISIDSKTGGTIATGFEAKEMLGRTPKEIKAIRPLKDGVIADFTATKLLLKNILERVCKRLGIVFNNATPRDVEYILKNEIPVDKWNRVSEQILLFGRYYCRAINPKCDNCLFKDFCKYKRN